MSDLRVSRRRILGAGATGTLAVLVAPQTVLAEDGQQDEVELLRWDLVDPTSGVVVAGADVARDAATGDKITLTGSGQAEPEEGRAAGGGTFRHAHANGSEVAHGVYFVTKFNSFENAGGSLVGVGLTDGIGNIQATTAGVLSLNVTLRPASGGSLDAVLEVHCNLPGANRAITEGVRLAIGPFHFVQFGEGSFTLFHVLEA